MPQRMNRFDGGGNNVFDEHPAVLHRILVHCVSG
jgi:hypothetical protein